MNLTTILNGELCRQLTVALFHVSWLGVLVGVLAATGNRILRNGPAYRRHWLSFVSLLVLGLSLPVSFAVVRMTDSTAGPVATFEPAPSSKAVVATPFPIDDPVEFNAAPAVARVDSRSAPRMQTQYAALAYLGGVVIMLSRLVLSICGGHRLRSACSPVTDPGILKIVARQCGRLRIAAIPAVGVCNRISVPAVLGIFQPLILLPAAMMTGLDLEQLSAILTHELAHIRRFDHLIIMLQRVIEAVLFFHPAVWYLSRCVNEERENCCDDLVLTAGGDRLEYCLSLLRVAELSLKFGTGDRSQTVLAADGNRPSRLRRRIDRLLGTADGTAIALSRAGMYRSFALLVLAATCLWVAAACSSRESEPQVRLVPDKPQTVIVSRDGMNTLKIRLAEAMPAPARVMQLAATVGLDPNRLSSARSRFQGEVVRIGAALAADGNSIATGRERSLGVGDHVQKGDILAVVTSTAFAEKTNDLIDALNRQATSERSFKALQKMADEGTVPERSIREAQRELDSAGIAVSKARRTLGAWRFTNDDVEELVMAAQRINEGRSQASDEVLLTTVPVVSAIDGWIVEKNVTANDLVKSDSELFKIADTSALTVFAHIAENQVAALRQLPQPIASKLRAPANPEAGTFEATIDRIGAVIDPATETALLSGTVKNPDGKLLAGQFVTATIELPAESDTVAVPISAILENAEAVTVFVETDVGGRQFTRRKVAVRHSDGASATLSCKPTDEERNRGAEPLRLGERVVIGGVPELALEFESLESHAPARGHK
jgi:beta-lactamase regulating signal transducer with metallopeptidase domain